VESEKIRALVMLFASHGDFRGKFFCDDLCAMWLEIDVFVCWGIELCGLDWFKVVWFENSAR
jgi:hypothetical protein